MDKRVADLAMWLAPRGVVWSQPNGPLAAIKYYPLGGWRLLVEIKGQSRADWDRYLSDEELALISIREGWSLVDSSDHMRLNSRQSQGH